MVLDARTRVTIDQQLDSRELRGFLE